jgi:hypothetical protein
MQIDLSLIFGAISALAVIMGGIVWAIRLEGKYAILAEKILHAKDNSAETNSKIDKLEDVVTKGFDRLYDQISKKADKTHL